jgi:acyl transferase domain-containing protein
MRTFDIDAKGMVLTSGVGTVVLKRLSEAKRDQDNIIAIIDGYSINNDGNRKVNYTAPSVLGQKECILEAQKSASISSDAISYVECHGTATELGDLIEVNALSDAFNENSEGKRNARCVIGSVKAKCWPFRYGSRCGWFDKSLSHVAREGYPASDPLHSTKSQT